ncbi:MAG: PAS domain S-box protein [Gammaproteobacteria bacterium]
MSTSNKESDYDALSERYNRLTSEMNTREHQLDIITRVVSKISNSLDFETILHMVANEARTLIDAETLAVPIINEQQTKYFYKAASGINAALILNQSFPIKIGMCGWVLVNRQPIFFGDGSEQLMDHPIIWESGMQSAILVPLICRGKIIGGLSGLGKNNAESFTQSDFEILSLFASQVSIAIDNSIIVGQLKQQRDYLSTTLNSIADAVISVDIFSHVTHINPVAMQLSGCQPDQFANAMLSDVFNIIHAETRQPIKNPLDVILKGGKSNRSFADSILISKYGSEYYISCRASSIRNENDEIIGAILVYHDITEQVELLDEIKNSELRYRRLIENLSDDYFIYIHDVEGIVNYVSPSITGILGYTSNEFMTHFSTYLTDDPINQKVEAYTSAGIKGNKQAAYELEIYAKNGSVHILRVSESPVFDKDGRVMAIEGVAHDVTEYRANEQALRRSQKMDAIGQLSGGIAHDFNNQLGIVIGYLDMLRDEFADDQPQYKWIDIASCASMRCIDLTAQLLSFARKQGKDKVIIDINTSLNNLKAMVTRSLTSEIEVRYQLCKQLSTVLMDEGEFHDALLNLVINARDAMSRNGVLSLKTSHHQIKDNALLNISGMKPGHYVELRITDNGKGMSKEIQDRIFEPFFTTKDIHKGTGLGMSMVYGFVKRHDGYIDICSEPGKGSSIHIYLPYIDQAENKPKKTLSGTNNQQLPEGDETILIVDDEPDLLLLANEYLSSLGYTTFMANNAGDALDILAANKDIDLLFSDVVMPAGVNGYELAEKARTLRPGLGVLLTSGYTTQKLSKENMMTFSAQLLNKPYRKSALARLVRDILDNRSPL